MAPNLMYSLCFTTLFLLAEAEAEEFKVGGDEGWRQPAAGEADMYKKWGEGLRFHVKDSLRFVYKNDSVMVVDKVGYYHCNTSKAKVFKDGNTVVNLERPGPAHFASADPDHCKSGQRLMVEVITLRSPDADAPSPSGTKRPSSLLPQLLFFYLLLLASASASLPV